MPDNSLFLPSSLWMTLTFSAALIIGLVIKVLLNMRQIRHVARHRDHVPASFARTLTLAAHQKAADYTIVKARWSVLEAGLGSALLLGWTLLGGLSLLNHGLLDLMGPGLAQQLTLLAGFMLISGAVDLPLDWYRTFVIEARFGFNRSTPALWLTDLLKSTLMGLAVGLPLAALVLWLMDTAGTHWWLWVWAVWMGFSLLMLLIYPTWIAPLFNRFNPLEDEQLKARVTALLHRCGFAVSGLYVMDGSKRSAHANAYFTGFGASKRIVFFDTLLAKLSPQEVDAVLAHELGHFKHKHVLKRIVSLLVLSFVGLACLGWLSTQIWFYTGLGVQPHLTAPQHALTLLLFMLVAPVFSFFVTPIMAHLSRSHEFEADAYAVQHTSGSDLASALLKLYEDNASTLTPDPVYAQFYYSHPPASDRLPRMTA